MAERKVRQIETCTRNLFLYTICIFEVKLVCLHNPLDQIIVALSPPYPDIRVFLHG